MTTQADLDALAAAVRYFTDQEIPNVTQWNVDPDVLKQSLTRIGVGFTDVEAAVDALETTLANITKPDGSLQPVYEWVDAVQVPTYVSASMFTLPGDQTTFYRPGHRLQATVAGGSKVIVTVLSLAYAAGTNTTTFTLTAAQLDAALSKIAYSLVRESAPAARTQDILDLVVTTLKLANLAVTTAKLADAPNGVTAAKLNDLAVETRALAAGAVTNLKVGFKSLVGSERIVDGSINGSVSLAPTSVTGDKVAPATLNGGHIAVNSINSGHVVDKSLWLASDAADRSIAYYNIAIGNVRGSWTGAQNEIAQKTIWADADLADLSISNRVIANNAIWINDKCANKSMLGYNSIVDGSVQIGQLAQGHTTAAAVQAGLNSSNSAFTGWRDLGAVQFNLYRTGWVHIHIDLAGWVIIASGGNDIYVRILQNGALVMQRHFLTAGNGIVQAFAPNMSYIGYWGAGNYRLSCDAYSANSAMAFYDGVIAGMQFA